MSSNLADIFILSHIRGIKNLRIGDWLTRINCTHADITFRVNYLDLYCLESALKIWFRSRNRTFALIPVAREAQLCAINLRRLSRRQSRCTGFMVQVRKVSRLLRRNISRNLLVGSVVHRFQKLFAVWFMGSREFCAWWKKKVSHEECFSWLEEVFTNDETETRHKRLPESSQTNSSTEPNLITYVGGASWTFIRLKYDKTVKWRRKKFQSSFLWSFQSGIEDFASNFKMNF